MRPASPFLIFDLRGIAPCAVALAILACVACVACGQEADAAADAESWPIRMHFPLRAGDVYSYAAFGRMQQISKVTSGGDTIENDVVRFDCQLAASVEVLESSDAGLPSRLRYRVHRFAKHSEEGNENLLRAGDEFFAVRTPDGFKLLLEDGEFPEGTTEALEVLLSQHGNGAGETDDLLYGTPHRKRVGEIWPIDRGRASAALLKSGIFVPGSRLTGKGTLRGVEEIGGFEDGGGRVLDVALEMHAEGAALPIPAELNLVGGRLDVRMSATLPADREALRDSERSEVTLKFTARGRRDPGVELAVDIRQSLQAKYRMVYRAPRRSAPEAEAEASGESEPRADAESPTPSGK